MGLFFLIANTIRYLWLGHIPAWISESRILEAGVFLKRVGQEVEMIQELLKNALTIFLTTTKKKHILQMLN